MLKTQTKYHRYIYTAIVVLTSMLAVYIRYLGRDFLSADLVNCLTSWYHEIVNAGPGIDALLNYTGDYAFPYVFLIWLLSKLPIPFQYGVKILSSLFDFGLAVVIGMIIQFFRPKQSASFCIGYCATLFFPNVFLNSSFWGQCDSIYTFFLFSSFLCYLHKKYPWMMIFFGMAFSFKLQSIFFLPFLLIAYWLEREFSILQFLYVPAVMLVANIPIMIAGRSPTVIITQYTWQATGYPWLYYFYPNPYFFFQARPYYLFSTGVVFLAVTVFLIFVVLLIKHKTHLNNDNVLSILFWIAFTCPFFLPSMHERYGYFAELLALILALVDIRKVWVVVVITLCTLPMYLYVLGIIGNPLWLQGSTAICNIILYLCFTLMLWKKLFQKGKIESC